MESSHLGRSGSYLWGVFFFQSEPSIRRTSCTQSLLWVYGLDCGQQVAQPNPQTLINLALLFNQQCPTGLFRMGRRWCVKNLDASIQGCWVITVGLGKWRVQMQMVTVQDPVSTQDPLKMQAEVCRLKGTPLTAQTVPWLFFLGCCPSLVPLLISVSTPSEVDNDKKDPLLSMKTDVSTAH